MRRETGDVKPKSISGGLSKKGAALCAELLPQLEAHPDATLDEHCQRWENTHSGEKVRQAIEAQGCQLLFLPSYSPALSPIEEAFSKLKADLRRVGARTPEALQEAIYWASPPLDYAT